MPSRPVQLAGLSLEPVCQLGYLTASERGINGTTEKGDSEEREKKSHQSCWSDGVTALVAKRNSLVAFTGRDERESSWFYLSWKLHLSLWN